MDVVIVPLNRRILTMKDVFHHVVLAVIAVLLLSSHIHVNAYYVPEANPVSYREGDIVHLKVNKVSSTTTLYPLDYYDFPFCTPHGGVTRMHENLGEFLAGDRIVNSAYVLKMKQDMYCEQVCIANLGRAEEESTEPSKLIRAFHMKYYNNWIVDNLPAAYKEETDKQIVTRYWQGFPLGYVDKDTNKAYVHNHVNIEVVYNGAEGDAGNYQVVQVLVTPFSIKHNFEPFLAIERRDDYGLQSVAVIHDSIPSCAVKSVLHTSYEMVTARGQEPQLASGSVLFTYDVIWTETKELKWASRWEIYLSMDGATPDEIHWFNIFYAMVFVTILSAKIMTILGRDLRYHINQSSNVSHDLDSCAVKLGDHGWRSVHADVFRPPKYPMLMSVLCGTGVQLLFMSLLVISFFAFDFLSPIRRGHLIMSQLVAFVVLGGVNGYVAARLYKTFEGNHRQRATVVTALVFPSLAFSVFLVLNGLAFYKSSTYAVPLTVMLTMIVLWLGVSTPLVFIGAFFGYKQEAIGFPVKAIGICRDVPDQRWFTGLLFTMVASGMIPFVSFFAEFYFVYESVWMGYFYYSFGFLWLTFFILIIMCAEITVLLTYFQLRSENYHWWWRSFCNSGSIAIYIFMYSIYVKVFEVNMIATSLLYFGTMGFISICLFIMMGCIGLLTSLWFNKTIYSSIKVK